MKGRVAALVVVLLVTPFVVRHEGVVPRKYGDPIGIPTACIGETDREVVSFKDTFSRDECVAVMGASLMAHAIELDKCVAVPLARHEAAAVLSWSYNVGVTAACRSTLIRLMNAGRPATEWCAQLSRWNKAGGRVLPGLVRRRAEERALCEGRA